MIDWQRSALAIHNQVRGFYPSCLTQYRQQPLKIYATLPLVESALAQLPADWSSFKETYTQFAAETVANPIPPGTIVGVLKNYGPIVATGDGNLLLRNQQPAGKKAQSGWDFANGSRLTIGEILG